MTFNIKGNFKKFEIDSMYGNLKNKLSGRKTHNKRVQDIVAIN